VIYRSKNGVIWKPGVVVTVNEKNEQDDMETYDIVLLARVKKMDVEGVANRLKRREIYVSCRLRDGEAWKDGVVVKHHVGTNDVAETYDIKLNNGEEVKGLSKGKKLRYGTVKEHTEGSLKPGVCSLF
jgi:hypothetical protein